MLTLASLGTPRPGAPGARAHLRFRLRAAGVVLCLASPAFALAQQPGAHDSHTAPAPTPNGMSLMMSGPLGLPMSRTGSGTSWVPDSSPMFGVMKSAGGWGLMAHASVFVQGDAQGGPRGASQFGSLNWGMVGATHALAGGRLQLRGMFSADAFTVGGKGYPLLLQTGETYRGAPIHDRQHPHDLFMELAAVYDRALTANLAMQLYAAPSGEPAIGPVAFPHRLSAAADPFATIGHHWQDATHVSFGVVTVALYSRRVKIEGSLFNGREPDDIRTNLDLKGAKLDAVALRVTASPNAFTSLTASYARMPDAEKAHPGEAVQRMSASLLHTQPRGDNGSLSLALIYGANAVGHEHWTPSVTGEAAYTLDARTTLFTRAEVVSKSAEELALPTNIFLRPIGFDDHGSEFAVGAISLGAIRELATGPNGMLGLGVRGTVNVVPASLRDVYGSRTPQGGTIFLRWRPSRMDVAPMHNMPGMHDMRHTQGGSGAR